MVLCRRSIWSRKFLTCGGCVMSDTSPVLVEEEFGNVCIRTDRRCRLDVQTGVADNRDCLVGGHVPAGHSRETIF